MHIAVNCTLPNFPRQLIFHIHTLTLYDNIGYNVLTIETIFQLHLYYMYKYMEKAEKKSNIFPSHSLIAFSCEHCKVKSTNLWIGTNSMCLYVCFVLYLNVPYIKYTVPINQPDETTKSCSFIYAKQVYSLAKFQ